MKYKVGDIIFIYTLIGRRAIIEKIIQQNSFYYYRFRYTDNNYSNTMSCNYIDELTELDIKYSRREKLKKLNEI